MNAVTALIKQRREACGYQVPAQRTGCRHCTHAHEKLQNIGSWAESSTLVCLHHDFSVSKGAICDDFAAAGPSRSAR